MPPRVSEQACSPPKRHLEPTLLVGRLRDPQQALQCHRTRLSSEVRRRQTLERKAAFIAQVTRGDLPDRDVDDLGDQTLSFAEVKALATGDPFVLEKAGVDADVARLTRLERAHVDDQHRLRLTNDVAVARAEGASQLASRLEAVLGRVTDTRADRFVMTVDGRRHTKRVEAGSHLERLLLDHLDRTPPESTGPVVEVGTLAGLAVTGQAITTIEDEIRFAVPDAHIEVRYAALDWKRSEPSSVITRLERQIQRLPETLEATRAEAEQARGEAERAQSRIGAPWDRADELAHLRRRQQDIDEQLAAVASKSPDSAPPLESSPAPQGSVPSGQGTSSVPGDSPGSGAADSATSSDGSTSPLPGRKGPADSPPVTTLDSIARSDRPAARGPGAGAPGTSTVAEATARLDAIQSRPGCGSGMSR